MNKGFWGVLLLGIAGCEREAEPPPLPSAVSAPVETRAPTLPPEAPPDPVKDLRDALAGTRLLEEMIRIAKLQRSSPNLEKSACMSRFMHYRPKREVSANAFRALPDGTPGADELQSAALSTSFCINCAAGDESHCAEASRLLLLGTKKLETVTKGLE